MSKDDAKQIQTYLTGTWFSWQLGVGKPEETRNFSFNGWGWLR